jgi:hypothetical protein
MLVDSELDRIVYLGAENPTSLRHGSIEVGQNITKIVRSAAGDRLFVLSAGEQPRLSPEAELPALTVIDDGPHPEVFARYELSDPFSELTLDPEGQWVVLTGATDASVVVNPNELILIDVSDANFEPVTKTIRSFGGRPTEVSFTPELGLPEGPRRRLLLVQTERDVSILDLMFLDRTESTLGLPQTESGQSASPVSVVVDDGDPEDVNDTRLAVQLGGQSDVVLVEFLADPDRSFRLLPRLADAGGIPSQIAFVNTDQGLRLAALNGTQAQAALIDPVTTGADFIRLPGNFTRLTRLTAGLDEGGLGDVALLWGPNVSQVAFWSLGQTGDSPFRSVEGFDLQVGVQQVLDVPGDNQNRKLLQTGGAQEFFILDLQARQSFPMVTQGGVSLSVSPDGERAWALRPGSKEFAQIDLQTLHPRSVAAERPIDGVFDIEAENGGRALVALHARGSYSVTLLDAEEPDPAASRHYPGLMLEDLQ